MNIFFLPFPFFFFSSTFITQCQNALFELSNVFQGVLAPIWGNDLFIMLGLRIN